MKGGNEIINRNLHAHGIMSFATNSQALKLQRAPLCMIVTMDIWSSAPGGLEKTCGFESFCQRNVLN